MHPRLIKKKTSNQKHALQARFFMEQNAPQARLIKQNARQADFFDKVLMGTLSCERSMLFFSTNHSSESSSLINE